MLSRSWVPFRLLLVVGAMLFLALPSGHAFAHSWSAYEKCTPRPPSDDDLPEIVRIIDHEIVDEATLAELPRESIDRVEIICWKQVEEIHRVRVRLGAILVITKAGPPEAALATLTRLIAGQDAHFRKHGSYSGDPASLGSPGAGPFAQVSLTVTDDGWAARVQHDFVGHLCYAFVGTAPAAWIAALAPAEPELREREPVCFSRDRDGLWQRSSVAAQATTDGE